MFRIATWGLIGIIAAATAYWYSKGASLDGRRTATWTDLGTWGDGGLIPAAGVGAALDGARKAAEKADKEPIKKQADPAPAKDAEWEVAKKEPAKAAPAAESVSVTDKAINWPIAEAPISWDNVRIPAPAQPEAEAEAEPEVVAGSVITEAIEWPIADAPITWDNFRIAASSEPEPEAAPAEPEPAASVTAPAIEWPIADASITWDNVRIAAPAAPEPEAPAATVSVTAPAIEWPIADASITWDNVRIAAPAPPPVAEEVRRAELTPEQAACEDELRKIYAEGTILFKTSSAQVDSQSTATLDALAKAAKSCTKVRIRVEGHTDDRGSNAANQALSERRAQAVASYLSGAGVDAGTITSYGYGEERPVAPNTSDANRQKNRRIVFTVF